MFYFDIFDNGHLWFSPIKTGRFWRKEKICLLFKRYSLGIKTKKNLTCVICCNLFIDFRTQLLLQQQSRKHWVHYVPKIIWSTCLNQNLPLPTVSVFLEGVRSNLLSVLYLLSLPSIGFNEYNLILHLSYFDDSKHSKCE